MQEEMIPERFSTQEEVWRYLLAGGAVRPKWWPLGNYLVMRDGFIHNSLGQKVGLWAFSSPTDYVGEVKNATNIDS